MFRSGIYVLGGREVQNEATVLSLWRLLASKLSSLRLWWTGLWPGYVGNIASESGGSWQNTDGDKLIPFGWAFSCYFFAYEVLGCGCSLDSSPIFLEDQLGESVFLKNR